MATKRTGSGLRLRKSQLFSAIGYVPHDGQVLVHRSKASRRVLACGVRWGKSTCAAMEAVAALFEPRASALGWTVAPTYAASKRIFDEVVNTVHTHLPRHVHDYNPREHRLVVVNFAGGLSTLRGKSADNPVSLLSEAIDFVIVDEAARMKPEIWQQHLMQRLVDRNGWALLLSTPSGRNWFHKLFKRGQNGRDRSFESWAQPSWMNPHVSRELIEAERARMSVEAFAQEFEGSFGSEDREPCDRCGWPEPFAKSCAIVEDGHPLPRCPECDRYVDAEGHTTMGRDASGDPFMTLIELLPRFEPVDGPPLLRSDANEHVYRLRFGPSPSSAPPFPEGIESDPAISAR